MLFGLANADGVYIRMLNIAMKEVNRDFWTSYLDDILTYSGEPWAHFGHLPQVVLAHKANTIVQNQAVPVWGGVPGAQDQQGGSFHDSLVCTQDQGVART